LAKTIKLPARNRRSAPRDQARTSKQVTPTHVDPVAILEQIAGNKQLKPTPRVQACKELIRLRMLLGRPDPAPPAEAKKAEKLDRLDAEINRRALALMGEKGTA
jgi:hypothetical protein